MPGTRSDGVKDPTTILPHASRRAGQTGLARFRSDPSSCRGVATGSRYTAPDTRRFARDIGLIPRTTPIESPQSNCMAEAFVRTLKRDYARVNPRGPVRP